MFTEFLQNFCKYLMDIPAEEYIATGRKIYRDRQKDIPRPAERYTATGRKIYRDRKNASAPA